MDATASVIEKIKADREPLYLQVAPGRYRRVAVHAPEYAVGTFVPAGNDEFAFKPVLERMVRLDQRVLNAIGMGNQRNTLMRLGRAGFVEIVPAAPRLWLLNLDSWYNHVRRVAEEGESFWNNKRTRAYVTAIREGGQ